MLRYRVKDNEGDYWYVYIASSYGIKYVSHTSFWEDGTHFDTKEEAESWANSHQEVVEVEG